MKVIFLNAFFGEAGEPLFAFLRDRAGDTDVFCFQEIDPKLFEKISAILPNHRGRFLGGEVIDNWGYLYGQAVFIPKDWQIEAGERIEIFENSPKSMGFLQYMKLRARGRQIYLGNVHGVVFPADKFDSKNRIKQSQIIIDFFKDKKGPKIIGGDFNLMPQTKSVGMFEENGYRNLIKDFGIKDTRGNMNNKRYPESERQYFADYVFVSKDVEIENFEVPQVEISDHLPLILDFEVSKLSSLDKA